MLICWGEGHGSAIHDHADSHCFMKVLKGELSEIRYAWPSENDECVDDAMADIGENEQTSEVEYDGDQLNELSRSSMEMNGVYYINGNFIRVLALSQIKTKYNFLYETDNLGLHRVENPSHSNVAVSLHLYCPPFDSCSVFNKETGKRTNCKVTFWSKYGERRDKVNT